MPNGFPSLVEEWTWKSQWGSNGADVIYTKSGQYIGSKAEEICEEHNRAIAATRADASTPRNKGKSAGSARAREDSRAACECVRELFVQSEGPYPTDMQIGFANAARFVADRFGIKL